MNRNLKRTSKIRFLIAVCTIVFSAVYFTGCSQETSTPTESPIQILATVERPTTTVTVAISMAPSTRAASATVQAATTVPLPSHTPILTPARVSTVDGVSVPTQTLTVTPPALVSKSRGYLTTPGELSIIKAKADQGIEPYKSSVERVLVRANKSWNYSLQPVPSCPSADEPAWNDNDEGTPIIYAKALAFHLTNNAQYADEVRQILQRIMTEVGSITTGDQQCRLNFSWGTPELVASADLIEDYWSGQTCTGPISTLYTETTIGLGKCKSLFQNWLVKNPYYIVSYSAANATSNWGASATNTTAYIADYLWDRPEVRLIHRNPPQINGGKDLTLTPAEAYRYANKLAIDRMNGYRVDYHSSTSCDVLGGSQQSKDWAPIKSQINENGIIPEDARREEFCNIPRYNGQYENYPQLHIGNNVQQCELMLRRGDRSCFDNLDNTDVPNFAYVDRYGASRVTHLYPGRGSIERAIKAIIVDSQTQWKHDSGLAVAYRYYFNSHTLPGFESWIGQLNSAASCEQDICFGMLTHGFASGEQPGLPPMVAAPGER
ncbi:MAG: hypothetical protein HZB51_13590 [Chloroflexi bacterium]|nr:hypothetical protein [Chloroflexota bacterium]